MASPIYFCSHSLYLKRRNCCLEERKEKLTLSFSISYVLLSKRYVTILTDDIIVYVKGMFVNDVRKKGNWSICFGHIWPDIGKGSLGSKRHLCTIVWKSLWPQRPKDLKLVPYKQCSRSRSDWDLFRGFAKCYF